MTTPSTARTDPMTTTDTLIADYLQRLRRATADLPPGTRAELLDDIGAHLADTAGDAPDEARVRQVLDELGTPETIAQAARVESGGVAATPPTGGHGDLAYDVSTVLVLLLGGFVVPVLGWVAGVVMLWNGPRWTRGEKWFGTLIWPALVAVPLLLVTARPQDPAVWLWVGAVVLVVGLPTAFAQLLRRARRRA